MDKGTGATLALAPPRHLQGQATQYLRAFQLRRELYRKPGQDRSNTLSKQRSEINSVLRMSDTQNYEKIECPKDFLLTNAL